MNFKDLSVDTWKNLDDSGNKISGYKTTWLSLEKNENSNPHIFKDENGSYHFAIEAKDIRINDLFDPRVNGLKIHLNKFRLEENKIGQYIDLECSYEGFLEEFNEVIKEIARKLSNYDGPAFVSINYVLRKWKSFWSGKDKRILSLEEQIGLFSEILILEQLCALKPDSAFESWGGPIGRIHDFQFSKWDLEVKGTLREGPVHRINGIDQLAQAENKSLALISCLLNLSSNDTHLSLPDLIERVTSVMLNKRPDLELKLYELIGSLGYSPSHNNEYQKNRFEIISTNLYIIDETFPALNRSKLKDSLSTRISSVNYDLSFNGLYFSDLSEINWGDYFY